MVFYIEKEGLLACTAGQVNHDICSLGVSYEDVEEFIKQLKTNLPGELLIYIERLNFEGIIYCNDFWRNHYEMFMGRYRLKYETVFEQQEKSAIDDQIKIMKKSLNDSLTESNITSICDEQNPIDIAIDSFKKYYGQRYGVENLLIQDQVNYDYESKLVNTLKK